MAWVTNFALSPRSKEPEEWGGMDFAGRTARLTIPIRFDGTSCRIRLSNRYGAAPVKFRAGIATMVRGEYSSSPVSFESDEIPPGEELTSKAEYAFLDAGKTAQLYVYCETEAADRSSVFEAEWCEGRHLSFLLDKFVPDGVGPFPLGVTMDILTQKGIYKKDDEFCIAAFGDSITQMRLWTDQAERRTVELSPAWASFLNLGIGGNRLLRDSNYAGGGQFFGLSGLKRAEFELTRLRGLRRVFVALGINDISQPGDGENAPPISERPTLGELIDGFEQLKALIENTGAECVFCTVTPFKGMVTYCEETAHLRNDLNDWMRTQKHVDFAAAVCDPDDPEAIRPEYDSGDHLHPSREGGLAMAAAIPDEYLR